MVLDAMAAAAAADAEIAGAGTDPGSVSELERFGGYSHQEIWDRVHEALDPAALGQAAAAWQANALALGAAFEDFAATAGREFADWTGRSADQALRATQEFIAQGLGAQEVCDTVRRLLELNSAAAQTIRGAIAPPPHYLPLADPVAEAVHGGRRRMEHDLSAAAAQAEAQDVMTHLYNPTMPATGDSVPRFAGGSGTR
ncbi:hypothetical protein [Nocardia sp. XZ_19_385]|uniref:hypothetical protein n=1 Tax=Nocardia sp. XZ_19_385 TaxID=2769488 RepID=UPI001E62B3D7|nr:hypothetical protein [Nocardia sp. XZ_19_385]